MFRFKTVSLVAVSLVLAAALAVIGAASVLAQSPGTPQPAVKLPGFGAFMVMMVQPQHIKLGLAGKQRNWPLAEHASKELGEVFDYLVAVRPTFRNQSLATLIDTMTGEARTALDKAVKAGDGKQFDEAYERLTQGCNACHTSLNQAYIVIKVPDAGMYPDQDFRPQSK